MIVIKEVIEEVGEKFEGVIVTRVTVTSIALCISLQKHSIFFLII